MAVLCCLLETEILFAVVENLRLITETFINILDFTFLKQLKYIKCHALRVVIQTSILSWDNAILL